MMTEMTKYNDKHGMKGKQKWPYMASYVRARMQAHLNDHVHHPDFTWTVMPKTPTVSANH